MEGRPRPRGGPGLRCLPLHRRSGDAQGREALEEWITAEILREVLADSALPLIERGEALLAAGDVRIASLEARGGLDDVVVRVELEPGSAVPDDGERVRYYRMEYGSITGWTHRADTDAVGWWLALFWATIIFTPLYILYYHFGGGMLAKERYDAEMVAFFDKQAEELLALGEINESMLAGLTSDPSMMNSGEKIFRAKCATCHGLFGEGGIGPNLTDDYWLHGSQFVDVYATVRDGVTAKGMLAWERQLRPAELMAVSSYVGTLLGTDPPNAKAPQGTQVARLGPEEIDGAASSDEPVAEEANDEAATKPAAS